MASMMKFVDLRASVKSGTKGTERLLSWVLSRCSRQLELELRYISPILDEGQGLTW